MGIGTPHDLALVFEDLHPAVGGAKGLGLVRPTIHHAADGSDPDAGQGQVVARRKTKDATLPTRGLASQERMDARFPAALRR